MANIYWVGGAGTWDTTTTTNWASSSGGTGGTGSVPTAADNVFFNQAGTYTVSITGAATCQNITVSAGVVTFADGTQPAPLISGSMTLIASTVWSSAGAITFTATTTGNTITTNGVSIGGAIIFNGTGGSWTLGSALTLVGTLTLTSGTLLTGNYNVSAASLASSGTGTRFLDLGSSTVTLNNDTPINITGTTNFTFVCGTSTIAFTYNISGNYMSGYFGNLTYYNITFSYQNFRLATGMTCNNFTYVPGTVGVVLPSNCPLVLSDNITCTGTFTASGSNSSVRVAIYTYTVTGVAQSPFSVPVPGVARTITAAAVSLSDVDFMDITAAGAAAPFTGTRLGDAGGNSNITFPAPKTVYLASNPNSTSALWQGSYWSTVSGGVANGGTVSYTNYPLVQDTAVIDNNSLASGGTLYFHAPFPVPCFLSNITCANRSIPITLVQLYSGVNGPIYTGNVVLSPSVTLNLSIPTFSGSGGSIRTFNMNGAVYSASGSYPSAYISVSGTWKLLSDLNLAGRLLTIQGNQTIFDLNNYNFTTGSITFSGNSPTLAMGNGTVTVTNSGGIGQGIGSQRLITFQPNARIILTASTTKNLIGNVYLGGDTVYWPTVVQAGTGTLAIQGANNFYDITSTVTPATITFLGSTGPYSNGATTFNNFNLRGTAGNPITLAPAYPGNICLFTFNSTISTDYLSVSYIAATTVNGTAYVGANSTNGGNNTGLTFAAAPAVNSNVNISVSSGTVISGGARFT